MLPSLEQLGIKYTRLEPENPFLFDMLERPVCSKQKGTHQGYVPFLTGSLDERTQVVGNSVVYPGPYARFLYYGKVMVDPETGSTYAPKGGTKVVTDKNLVFNTSGHNQAQSHWFEASKAENLDKWLRVADKAVKNGL